MAWAPLVGRARYENSQPSVVDNGSRWRLYDKCNNNKRDENGISTAIVPARSPNEQPVLIFCTKSASVQDLDP